MNLVLGIAIFLLIVALACMVGRILWFVYLSAGMDKCRCLRCGNTHVKRSGRRLRDLPFRMFGLRPFRCSVCERRFYTYTQTLESPEGYKPNLPA